MQSGHKWGVNFPLHLSLSPGELSFACHCWRRRTHFCHTDCKRKGICLWDNMLWEGILWEIKWFSVMVNGRNAGIRFQYRLCELCCSFMQSCGLAVGAHALTRRLVMDISVSLLVLINELVTNMAKMLFMEK